MHERDQLACVKRYDLHAKLGNGTHDPGPYMNVTNWPVIGNVTKKLWLYSYPGQCGVMLYPWLGRMECEIHVREKGIPEKYIGRIDYTCEWLFWHLCGTDAAMYRLYSSNCSSL
ncbi:uncharacterized protein LOC142585063 isoform X3 [Dermacentor variabilis]|uniref:uncharacterized protein LOC142585063 isoform X3 n=1 Tax=Dermacentor variabilis TaxID=34621 RepID=UPI003F5BF9BB